MIDLSDLIVGAAAVGLATGSQVAQAQGTADAAIKVLSSMQNMTLSDAIISGRARPRTYSGTNWVLSPSAVTAGASVSANIGFYVYPGKRFFMTSLSMMADGPCQIYASVSADSGGGWATWIGETTSAMPYSGQLIGVIGTNGGQVDIQIPSGMEFAENMAVTIVYKSPTTAGRNVAFNAAGYEIDNELFNSAQHGIAVFGDSISWGGNLGNDASGRAFLGNSHWSRVLVDLARKNGVDAGIVSNMGDDGRTMLEGYYNLQTSKYHANAKTWFVSYGMNDASSAKFPTSAKFKEAAFAWINWRNRLYPNKDVNIVFLAPSNTDDTDRTGSGRIVSIRQWVSEVANDATLGGTANKVFFVDQSAAWALNPVSADDVNIKSSERGGVRVHPSGTGSTAIGVYLWDQLKTSLFGVV